MEILNLISCYVQTLENLIKENEGEWRGYGRTDRLNLTGIRAEANTCESHLFNPGIWVRRDAMTSIPMDSANVDPTF